MEKINSVLSSDLENQFENLRSGKTSPTEPILQNLWEIAIDLSHKYSIYEVSKYLRLNFIELINKIGLIPDLSDIVRQPALNSG